MKPPSEIFRCFWFAGLTALAVCLCLLTLDARSLLKAQFGVAQREGEKTRELADRHARQVEQDLRLRLDAALAEVKAMHGSADRQLTTLRTGVLSQVTQIRDMADRRLGDTLARADTALDVADGLQKELAPVLSGAVLIESHLDKSITDVHPQLLGLIAASKVAAGQTALTLRDIQAATPNFIADWSQISRHMVTMSDAGAKSFVATQHTMQNFAAASKPLPAWARIALGVGPPVAQAGAAAVGAGVLLHWFK